MRVIKYGNLPVRYPFTGGITMWLLLDRLQAPVWVQAVWWTLYAILFLILIVCTCLQEQVDVVK